MNVKRSGGLRASIFEKAPVMVRQLNQAQPNSNRWCTHWLLMASDGPANFGARPRLDGRLDLRSTPVGKREIARDPYPYHHTLFFFPPLSCSLSHGSGTRCLFFGGLDQNETEEFEGIKRERGAGKSAG